MKNFSTPRRTFFANTLLALTLLAFTFTTLAFTSCASAKNISTSSASLSETRGYTDVIQTKSGSLRGVLSSDKSVEFYGAIPYAEPPVGELRWKEPVLVKNWSGVLDATHYPNIAMQFKPSGALIRLFDRNYKENPAHEASASEDCLYLNIWKPSGKVKDAAVLVYFHGGALVIGSGIERSCIGEAMAREQNIIMVTVNYRLGIFGYFANENLIEESPNRTTGNYGLLDQILSLKWIHENIEYFGGDKNNITIAGQSAGSTSVNAICASPLAKGLFTRAIAQSSSLVSPEPFHTYWTMEKAMEESLKVMKRFGAKSIADMRKIPAKKLVKYLRFVPGVTVDGYALPKSVWEIYNEGKNNENALLHGHNKDEVGALGLFIRLSRGKVTKKNYPGKAEESFGKNYKIICEAFPGRTNKEAQQNYNTLVTIAGFAYTHRNWRNALIAQNVPVYEYYFTNEQSLDRMKKYGPPFAFDVGKIEGADNKHCSELPYAYGNMLDKSFTEADFALRKTMMTYWANFAKTGNPNGRDVPEWQSFNQSKKVAQLDSKIKMIDEAHSETFLLLDKLYE